MYPEDPSNPELAFAEKRQEKSVWMMSQDEEQIDDQKAQQQESSFAAEEP